MTEQKHTLSPLQGVILEIYKEVKKIFDRHGLRYYAIGGTCIGAVRHHGFIPWDDDLDVALPDVDFKRFIELAERELPPRYKLLISSDCPHRDSLEAKVYDTETTFIESFEKRDPDSFKGVFIDIFPMCGTPENDKGRIKFCKKLVMYKRFNEKRRLRLSDLERTRSKLMWFAVLPLKLLPYRFWTNKIHKMTDKYPFDDVTDPALTWWRKMEKYTGLRLLKNCSWSGSRVSGDSTSTSTAAAGCSTKRVKDLAVRDSGGNIVTAPDIILVYMSINDFRFDGMGTWAPSNALPTEGNLTTWREAYATMVSKIIREYPNAEVYCCTLLECTLGVIDVDDNTAWPVINGNGVSLAQWNDSIKEIAIGFGANVCDIHGCGISYWQVANYTGDLCHPNAAGMELIARKVTQELKAKSFYVI